MGRRSITYNEFIRRFETRANNEYEYIEGYTRMTNTIRVRCLKCGHEFNVIASAFINTKTECKHCASKDIGRKNFESNLLKKDYSEIISSTTNNEYKLISNYEGYNKDVEILHKKCNKTYITKYRNFARGNRCPYCK